MKGFTIHAAKTQLSKLIQLALNGEEVVISNRETPLVHLRPVQKPRRRVNYIKGKVSVSKDFNKTPKAFKNYG